MSEKTVRCKVTCIESGHRAYGPGTGQFYAKFGPVYSGSDENKAFFAATPTVSIELGVIRAQHFEAGKEYYLDITPAS